VHKRYGQRVIYEGFDFGVRRRERWCVMGVNGAGQVDAPEAGHRCG
jgi:ATPase subunit of ABC transporter with duplicated ATPase domains